MNRKKSREEAMKLVFEMSVNKYNPEEIIEHFKESYEGNFKEIDEQYLRRVLTGVNENITVIDEKIQEFLVNWKMNRISKINLAILRICAFEIMFEKDIPVAVSINEAVDLAKIYSDDKSTSFINGVLDKIGKAFMENEV